jgi:hypothetical protein
VKKLLFGGVAALGLLAGPLVWQLRARPVASDPRPADARGQAAGWSGGAGERAPVAGLSWVGALEGVPEERRLIESNEHGGPLRPEPAAPSGKLDPRSETFRELVDEVIPRRFYGAAARCYKGGLDRDRKLRLSVKYRVVSGEVSVADVKILHSTMGDEELEACILEQVRASRWRDERMPNWEEEDEILIRVRGLKRYLQPDEDEPAAEAEPEPAAAPAHAGSPVGDERGAEGTARGPD